MKMGGPAQRADFPVAEAAGDRKGWEHLAGDVYITIGPSEESAAPSHAGEQQARKRS